MLVRSSHEPSKMMRRTLLLALFTLSFAASAHAQNKKDFSVQRFYPAVGPGNYITVDGASTGGHMDRSYGLFLDYASDLLVVDEECAYIDGVGPRCADKEVAFVKGAGLLHLTASVSLKGRGQLSFDLPLGFSNADRFDQVAVAGYAIHIKPKEGFVFGDARLAGKMRLYGEEGEGLAIAATAFITLPTGMLTSNGDCRKFEECAFMGERGVQTGANAVAEFSMTDFRVAANVGAAYRPKRQFLSAEVGSEFRYGVAGNYDITPLFHLTAEVVGAANLVGSGDFPLEARGAVAFGQDTRIQAGGGGGILGDIGSPGYRLFLGAQYTPVTRDEDRDGIEDAEDSCPTDREDRDGFSDDDGCPDPDNDGDGILDDKDACDDEREDFDQNADDDGCPDNDNDGDGVHDGYDSCEGAKEDMDGDRDDDGCPDLDTDRDGVADAADKCPTQAEDTDGLGDEDGCPEDDFDGDAVKDTEDACPDATEWWNDILDQDGCPEEDADNDTVPDATDRCPDNAETLNGTADADGCPDGAMIVVLKGQVLMPTDVPAFDKNVLRGAPKLAETVADYIKRNHKRGNVRVVVVAPADQGEAAERARYLAGLIEKRAGRPITSAHVVGAPLHVEIELLPPGWTELPRPKAAEPAKANEPAKAPAKANEPANAPESGKTAPAAPAPGAPAPAAPSPKP